MNQIQLTSIAILLQRSLGHSAGGIDIQEVPRLLEQSSLEKVDQAFHHLDKVMEGIKAAEAALDKAQEVYNKAGGWGKAPEPMYKILKELQDAWHEARGLEAPAKEALVGLTQPWFEACGSPEWAGIYLPKLKYSTPRGSTNWDLTGPRPRVWIERSRPGKEGMGEPGEEVVTYDLVSGRLHWTERAEPRHVLEMANLLTGVDPQASKEAKELHAKWSILEIRSAFRRAQLAIPANDPSWSQKWDLLEVGLQVGIKAAESGTFYGPWMVAYFRTREEAQVFLDEVGATALAS